MESIKAAVETVKEAVQDKKTLAIGAGATTAALVGAYAWRRAANYVPKSGPYPAGALPADAYDGKCC